MSTQNYFITFVCLIPLLSRAQSAPCTSPSFQMELLANNIKARILNSGDLFTDRYYGQFTPGGAAGKASTIYTAGLWIGGVDPGGNLKLAANTYYSPENQGDFWSGPLNDDGTATLDDCKRWDWIFMARYDRIQAFLADASVQSNPDAAIAKYREIMSWPGRDNPYFAGIRGFELPSGRELAPFFDADGDGRYDPLQGDYPVVALRGIQPFTADAMMWCVFNDVGNGQPHGSRGNTLQVEVQQMAWAFHCPDEPVLENTIFTAHKIINKSAEQLDSCAVGLWVDFDLGCPDDDYVGCNPALNTFFAYNQDKLDGSQGIACNGVATFGDRPPVQSVTLLNKPLDKFVPLLYIQQFIGFDVSGPVPYYNMMTGRWPNGVPLTQGGNGYNPNTAAAPVSHVFPGDPGNPAEWSMCSTPTFNGDRRTVGATAIGRLAPGGITELVTAWTHHPYEAAPCHLGSTFEDVQYLHRLYENNFRPEQPVCNALAVRDVRMERFEMAPNPTSGLLTISYPNQQPLRIRIADSAGRLVQEISAPNDSSTRIDTRDWPPGLYSVQLITTQGRIARPLVVLR